MLDEFAELKAYLRRVPAIGTSNAECSVWQGKVPKRQLVRQVLH